MALPLMPKATAVWLVDNTMLSFEQIGTFCGLHTLEVQGIADGEIAQNITGLDPIVGKQLTAEEIKRCEDDPSAQLELLESNLPAPKKRRGPRYTPVSKRQDRPDAIAWLVRNHEELTDAQISKLVSTTKPTIVAIRERTHWNYSNLKPTDPVTLGLCTQIELDEAIQKAADRVAKEREKAGLPPLGEEEETNESDLGTVTQPDIWSTPASED
jgi:hypothetical protein